uniref:Mycofactocin system glycosyltransferase n=1 Tax=Thermorudis peleae TaxID=1382356 RepID=A0A831TDQ0_9BACT
MTRDTGGISRWTRGELAGSTDPQPDQETGRGEAHGLSCACGRDIGDPGSLRCWVAPGVRVIESGASAWIVALSPLRIWQVRPPALLLLERCREGHTLGEAVATVPSLRPEAALRFLERLAENGVVHFEPALTRGDLPSVSVVIPVRNRPRAIDACLAAIARLDYPRDRLEVIVVDDASTDETPSTVERWAARLPLRLIRMSSPSGPSACRNRGAAEARGEVLAFTDSDCLPEPAWLLNLIPELSIPRVVAAGGAVLPAAEESWLQRYEAVRSPLYHGRRRAVVRPRSPVPYLVTANLIIRRCCFLAAGGFAEIHPGEDVDLIWRLCAGGARVHYRPDGVIRHDHRDRLWPFMRRRAAYAGSEAVLLQRHPDNGRYLVVPMALVLGVVWTLVNITARRRRPWFGLALPAAELALAAWKVRGDGVPVETRAVLGALLRGYGAFLYWSAVNVGRYYAVPLLGFSFAARPPGLRRALGIALGVCLLGPAIVDWLRFRPRLSLAGFALAHVLDALAYHLGSLVACARYRTLRPLRLDLVAQWPVLWAPSISSDATRQGRR